jgi:curved DNA-binding protein CbpA
MGNSESEPVNEQNYQQTVNQPPQPNSFYLPQQKKYNQNQYIEKPTVLRPNYYTNQQQPRQQQYNQPQQQPRQQQYNQPQQPQYNQPQQQPRQPQYNQPQQQYNQPQQPQYNQPQQQQPRQPQYNQPQQPQYNQPQQQQIRYGPQPPPNYKRDNSNLNYYNNQYNNNYKNNNQSNNPSNKGLVSSNNRGKTNNRLNMKFEYPSNNINISNVNDTIKNLNNIETNERQIFENQQRERETIFDNEQNKRRGFFDTEIKSFEENYNPYSILDLSSSCSVGELKKKYKRLALKYHPDRNNGKTDEEFKLITQSYLYILNNRKKENYLQEKVNKDVVYQEYQDNINESRENIHLDKDNFNVDKFNKIFNQYKIPSVYDEGYGDIMSQKSNSREKIKANSGEIFGNSFNIDVFNSTFKNEKKNNSNKIIKYEEPKAINLSNNMGFSELGVDKVDNYGVKNEGLGYTDYKLAHQDENMLINTDSVKVKSYQSINHLKADRENISYDLSEENRRRIDMMKRENEEKEGRRLHNLQNHDRIAGEQFNRINHLMISNNR